SGEFDVLEPPVGTVLTGTGQPVLFPVALGVRDGFEVDLADQGGTVSGVVEHFRDAGGVLGQRHSVGDDPVCAGVLPGQHARACRAADGVLAVGPFVPHPLLGEPVGDGCTGDLATVAPVGVVALLVRGDEEDLAAPGVAFVLGGGGVWFRVWPRLSRAVREGPRHSEIPCVRSCCPGCSPSVPRPGSGCSRTGGTGRSLLGSPVPYRWVGRPG